MFLHFTTPSLPRQSFQTLPSQTSFVVLAKALFFCRSRARLRGYRLQRESKRFVIPTCLAKGRELCEESLFSVAPVTQRTPAGIRILIFLKPVAPAKAGVHASDFFLLEFFNLHFSIVFRWEIPLRKIVTKKRNIKQKNSIKRSAMCGVPRSMIMSFLIAQDFGI
jgi:hypothetical protein